MNKNGRSIMLTLLSDLKPADFIEIPYDTLDRLNQKIAEITSEISYYVTKEWIPWSLRFLAEKELELSECYFFRSSYYLRAHNEISFIEDAIKCLEYPNFWSENTHPESDIQIQKRHLEHKFRMIFLSVVLNKIKQKSQQKLDYESYMLLPCLMHVLDNLCCNNLLDSKLSAYLAFIAIDGFDGELKFKSVLVFLALVARRLDLHHQSYPYVKKYYNECLAKVQTLPYDDQDNFLKYKCYLQGRIYLFDDWLMSQMRYKFLFQPSREMRFPEHSHQEFSVRIEFKSLNDALLKHRDFLIKDRTLIKFIGHFHNRIFQCGAPPGSPLYLIDITLKQEGIFDPTLSPINFEGLKRLKDPTQASKLLSKIKSLAPQYNVGIGDERELTEGIKNLYEESISRYSALDYFRRFYFEEIDFLEASFLLYKSLDHDMKYIQTEFLSLAIEKFKAVRELLRYSYLLNETINVIYSANAEDQYLKEELKKICKRIIDRVSANKKVLLQIQALDSQLSHAIYAIIELNDQGDLQAVLCNGGLGSDNHTRVPPVDIVDEPSLLKVFRWQKTDWNMFSVEKPGNEPKIKYKIILAKKSILRTEESFCRYLGRCISGKYYFGQLKYSQEKFIKAIYNPNAQINDSGLPDLIIADSQHSYPPQVMGNCTVQNAFYAIKYAVNLSSFEESLLKHMIECGIDKFRLDLEQSQQRIIIPISDQDF